MFERALFSGSNILEPFFGPDSNIFNEHNFWAPTIVNSFSTIKPRNTFDLDTDLSMLQAHSCISQF